VTVATAQGQPAGPTALVTGASGGIGRAIAEQLAARGYGLILVARSAGRLEALATEWTGRHGVPVRVLALDLTAPDAPERVAEAVAQAMPGGGLDVLVNNAGIGDYGLFREVDAASYRATLQLDVVALTLLTQRLLPALIARRGKLLNVASAAAFQPVPYMAVYAAAKAYVLSLSQALSEELRDTGVTVTALCPGFTQTAFVEHRGMDASAMVKGRRLPSAQEVAGFGVRAMLAGRPVAVHGWRSALLAMGARFAPRRLLLKTVRRLVGPG